MTQFNLEPEEKILLLGRLGRFGKKMQKIRILIQQLLENDRVDSVLRDSDKDKLIEIKEIASKGEEE